MTGEIQMAMTDVNAARLMGDSGRFRLVAILARQRLPGFPEVPLVQETVPGMASYIGNLWYGYFAPPQTPGELAMQIRNAFAEALKSQEVRKVILNDGQTIVGGTPEQLQQEVAREFDKIGALVRSLNLAK